MIVISMALVLVGFVALLLGVLGAGEAPLQFVYASIGACLLAAVFLVTGVLRGRPSRRPALVDDPEQPTWSGALPPATPAAEPPVQAGAAHVQVLSAREATREAVAVASTAPLELQPDATGAGADAGPDAEDERFVQALAGLDLEVAKVERLRGRFVTVERLIAASPGELAEVPGISAALAATVHAHLRSRD